MFFSEKINRGLPALAVAVCIAGCALHKTPEMTKMNFTDPNNYTGSDIERINAAIRDSRETGGIVRIFKRKPDKKSDRDFWLIDSAILLPEDTTLYITNCKIKLSDKARDNWIRSANCIVGNSEVKVLSNIHIIGEGSAVFEGADHPRATGDSGKTLMRDVHIQPQIILHVLEHRRLEGGEVCDYSARSLMCLGSGVVH